MITRFSSLKSLIFISLITFTLINCTGEQGPDGELGPPGTAGLVITTVVSSPPIVSPGGTSTLRVRFNNSENHSVLYRWTAANGGGTITNPTSANPTYTAPTMPGTDIVTVKVMAQDDTVNVFSIGEVAILVGSGGSSGGDNPAITQLIVYEAGTSTSIADDGTTSATAVEVIARTNVSMDETVGNFQLILNGDSHEQQMTKDVFSGIWQGRINNVNLTPNTANTFQVRLYDTGNSLLATSATFTVTQSQSDRVELSYENGIPSNSWQYPLGNNGGACRMTQNQFVQAKLITAKIYILN